MSSSANPHVFPNLTLFFLGPQKGIQARMTSSINSLSFNGEKKSELTFSLTSITFFRTKSYTFETTWGWVNDDMLFHFSLNYPLNISLHTVAELVICIVYVSVWMAASFPVDKGGLCLDASVFIADSGHIQHREQTSSLIPSHLAVADCAMFWEQYWVKNEINRTGRLCKQ